MTTDDSELPTELAAAIDRLDQLVTRFEAHPDPAVKDRVFELLMGNDVGPRRDFIVDGAAQLDRDRIDA